MKAKLSILPLLCLALLLALPPCPAYGQIKLVKCNVCNKPVSICPYKGKHPTTGTLSVTSTPSDAVVKIDGVYMGTTPLTLKGRRAGTYTVTISAEGYETQTKSVTVTAGKTATCSVTLKKKQASQPQPQPQPQQPQPTPTPSTTTTQTPSSSSIETVTVKGISFNMVRVEGGTFQMGSTAGESDEKPVHQVTVSSFSIGQTEVTQELWEAVMGSNPDSFKGSKLPVSRVSWNDCQTFIAKLNQLTGKKFRLPTEAEWEYAARGGNKSKGFTYSGSNTIDDVAWNESNSGSATHDVATKSPNELGIYDMTGNVWEWCQDWYGEKYYSNSPSSNPTGPSSGSSRVERGGGWSVPAGFCRVPRREKTSPASSYSDVGLRLAL